LGRKSRLKREHREFKALGLQEQSNDNLVFFSKHHDSVYRFFPEDLQADALVSGKVWITTLEVCRAYEDPKQGDSEEAHEIYNSGHAVCGSSDLAFVEIARRSGIHIGPGCSNITISNNTNIRSLPNAYVLCTTIQFSPGNLSETFGKYCVEITDPKKFFVADSRCLEKITAVKKAVAGKVIYRDRNYCGLERPPGPIGFVKPHDKYAEQKEFRFLWIPETTKNIKPFLLNCHEIVGLCRRIN
jgi:hypothetical protein